MKKKFKDHIELQKWLEKEYTSLIDEIKNQSRNTNFSFVLNEILKKYGVYPFDKVFEDIPIGYELFRKQFAYDLIRVLFEFDIEHRESEDGKESILS